MPVVGILVKEYGMKTENISQTVNKLVMDNGDEITLIGTAHVSANSVEEVKQTLDEVRPDMVCIELDQGRFDTKTKNNAYSNMDLKKVFKEGKTFLVLANTALASFQKKMGNNTGSQPGEEILSAGRYAQEAGIPVSLCDRDITITFKRAWGMSSLWNKAKLIASLIATVFDKEQFSEEDMEEMKNSDTLQEMMNALAEELPAAKTALIDERDRYLATSIFKANGTKKVAVVGAGHAGGIIKTIEKLENGTLSSDLSDISEPPKPSKFGKVATWLVPVLLIAFIAFSCFAYGFNQGVKYFLIWVLSNGLCSMAFVILSLGHPLNWLVAAVSAPISVMSPVIGVGMFTGIAEASLNKPKVKDFETISDDISKFKGWFKNRVLHAFLIFFTSTLGSLLGTVALFPIMLKFFK